MSPDEGLDRWSRESIHILPAGVFVWKDDFVDARTRKLRRVPEDEIVALENSSRDHIKFLQQQLELPANDPDVALWEIARHKTVGHQENIVWQLNVSIVAASRLNESFKSLISTFPAVNPKARAVCLTLADAWHRPPRLDFMTNAAGVLQHFIKTL